MPKFLQGFLVFVLGIAIAYAVSLRLIDSSNNAESGLIATLIIAVCYLAAVLWVAALKIIEAIKHN